MMQWLDKLNLQPHERRWLLVGLVVLALVLNYWLVWPYFGEWKQVQADLAKLESNRGKYQSEIGKKPAFEKQLKELQKAGAEVLHEDQANQLQATIQSLALANGVSWDNIRPIPVAARAAQTNSFFEEQQMTVEVAGGESELVNFLYALGSGDSMIRVRDMSRLRLDPSLSKLRTTLTVVASFQKKPKPAPTQPSRPGVVQSKGPAPTNAGVAQPKGPAPTNAGVVQPRRPAPTNAGAALPKK